MVNITIDILLEEIESEISQPRIVKIDGFFNELEDLVKENLLDGHISKLEPFKFKDRFMFK